MIFNNNLSFHYIMNMKTKLKLFFLFIDRCNQLRKNESAQISSGL